jgi:hypothetical protein
MRALDRIVLAGITPGARVGYSTGFRQGGQVAEDASGDTYDLVLVWQRGDRPGTVEFVVTSSLAEELLALLTEGGVSAAPAPLLVRGAGADVLTTVTVVAGNPAAWAAAGLAIKKFIDRHKGKKIQIDEHGLAKAENYSVRDLERILRALSAAEQDSSHERR